MTELNKSAAEILSHAGNVYSQEGEDGIIGHLLGTFSDRNRWCVEFGAWDGIYLSNTFNLIENDRYRAVLIEGDRSKFAELCRNMERFPDVVCLNEFVGFSESDSLDSLLAGTDCSIDPDFLSIDIDGNDYHALKAMRRYRPKLICVEYNPTIPSFIRYVQPADPQMCRGNSLLALVELGREMGYRLACANRINAFLVREDLWKGEFPDTPEHLGEFRADEPPLSVVFSGYDGMVMLTEPHDLPWHGYQLTQDDIQILPSPVRHFPANYNSLQRKMFRWHRRLRRLLKR